MAKRKIRVHYEGSVDIEVEYDPDLENETNFDRAAAESTKWVECVLVGAEVVGVDELEEGK